MASSLKSMYGPIHYPMKQKLLLTFALLMTGCSSLRAEGGEAADAAPTFRVHPQVFCLIQGWIADTESPVITEINLDAVDKNRNQFSKTGIKQEGDWTVCREADAPGFRRYRVLEQKGGHFKVEYQENDGGTLTTSSVIGFSLMKRELMRNGKSTSIEVIRVDDYTSK